MAWTHHQDDAAGDTTAARRRRRIRRIIGDTHGDPQLISDEDLDDILSENGNDVNRSALDAVDAALARFAWRPTSRARGPEAESYASLTQRLQQLRSLILTRLGPRPYGGGISIDEVEDLDDDSDNQLPHFHEDLARVAQPDAPDGRDRNRR